MKRLRTLAIDIGGSGLKASVVDPDGKLLADRLRIDTPHPCPPAVLVEAVVGLVAPLPAYDRISIGFPGYVRDGHVFTAPNLGNEDWAGFALAAALSKRLGDKPARLLNDADMQGLAVISGQGLELVITLGTGTGSAWFRDGVLMPHMEIGHHPLRKGKTYEDYLGNAARKRVGNKRWSEHLLKTIPVLEALLHFDRLYIGGGNAERLTVELPPNVTRVPNAAGIEGGAAAWRQPDVSEWASGHQMAKPKTAKPPPKRSSPSARS